MSDLLTKDKALALFQYLKQFAQINLSTITDINKQLGHVFLDDMDDPNYITIASRDTLAGKIYDDDKPLIHFRKPSFTACPEPPAEIKEWLEEGWDDWEKEEVAFREQEKMVDSNAEKLGNEDIGSQHLSLQGDKSTVSEAEIRKWLGDDMYNLDTLELDDVDDDDWDDIMKPFHQWLDSLNTNEEGTGEIGSNRDSSGHNESQDTERVLPWKDESLDELFETWCSERRVWVAEQKHIERLRECFNLIYSMYSDRSHSPDTLELVLGNGMMTFSGKSEQPIRHPVFMKRVSISLNAKENALVIYDSDYPAEIDVNIFTSIEGIEIRAVQEQLTEIANRSLHPLDKYEGSDMLKALTHSLSSDSRYIGPLSSEDEDLKKVSERLVIRWQPVLFLRKRQDKTINAIESIISAITDGAEIPGSLGGILVDPPENIDIGDDGESWPTGAGDIGTASNTFSQGEINDEDILLPMPANEEQLSIVREIEHQSAVVVQGPPGTGKTHTIANLIGHFLAQGKTVLVTSETSKALSVLRNKLPSSIRDLCVAVLGESQDRKELEESINQIVEGISGGRDVSIETIDEVRSKRHQMYLDLEKAKKDAFQIRYKEFQPIIFRGESMSPGRAGEFLSEHMDEMKYIPGDVLSESMCPLLNEEIYELYTINQKLTVSDEEEFASGVPEIQTLIRPKQLTESGLLDKRIEESVQKIEQEFNLSLDWVPHNGTVVESQSNQVLISTVDGKAIDDLLTHIRKHQKERPGWALHALVDGINNDYARKKWESLITSIESTYNSAQDTLTATLQRPVKLENNANVNQLIPVFEDICKSSKKSGNVKRRFLQSKEWKNALDAVTVRDVRPQKYEDVEVALQWMKLVRDRSEVATLWDSLLNKNGEMQFANLGEEPERVAYQYIKDIKFWLNWSRIESQDILGLAKAAGLGRRFTDPYEDITLLTLQTARDLCDNIVDTLLPIAELASLLRDRKEFVERKKHTELILGQFDQTQLCSKMRKALQESDYDQYASLYQRLDALGLKRETFQKRMMLLDKIQQVAPEWANTIKKHEEIHAEELSDVNFQNVWAYKQLEKEVRMIANLPYAEAEKRVTKLTTDYQKITEQYASLLAWKHLRDRVTKNPAMQKHLKVWSACMEKMGKGTGKGKKITELHQQARASMIECQKSVPAWIMPISQVMESVDPENNRFDVVIIDEASQSNISSTTVLYMGEKVIVVGDKEQVSPLPVGIDSEKLLKYREVLLKGKISGYAIWDEKTSIYDIASQVYNPLMLKEHFRCVPDIIEYSNELSYGGKIKPLREAASSPLKTPTISYRVPGVRIGKTNHKEAETIVAIIKACLKQPEYAHQTFGVISLLGEDQVKLINGLILNHISMKDIEEHQILVGNASSLQGDERDVILLSLVDSNEKDGPLKLVDGKGASANGNALRQRYNVAVSRARNQLWVVHSLDITKDLKPDDMRRNLIAYAMNPQDLQMKKKEIARKSDSLFEEEVARALVREGYHIQQQYPVGAYRIDIAVIYQGKKIAVECDGERWHSSMEQIQKDVQRQRILERLGWKFIRLRGSEYFYNKPAAIARVTNDLKSNGFYPEAEDVQQNTTNDELLDRIKADVEQIRIDRRGR